MDAAGDAYVTGFTFSANFPTVNPLQPTSAVTLMRSWRSSHPMGRRSFTQPTSVVAAVNWATGSRWIPMALPTWPADTRFSADFPTVIPLQPTLSGSFDAFVAKLTPTGAALVYATYLGGSGQ